MKHKRLNIDGIQITGAGMTWLEGICAPIFRKQTSGACKSGRLSKIELPAAKPIKNAEILERENKI